jgi:hypothetical protein
MEPHAAMDAVAISAAVVALVQMVKWAGLPDKYGPLAVLAFSALGVALWMHSEGHHFQGPWIWQSFTGWVNVALSAAGIFGFTRAGASSVTRMTPPPHSGAGSAPTVKE